MRTRAAEERTETRSAEDGSAESCRDGPEENTKAQKDVDFVINHDMRMETGYCLVRKH